jgi:AcrR family transcriptional regulator
MPTKPASVQRKNPQQDRSQHTRERILEAAAHLFSEYGIAGTSTNAIARAARMSIGSLYRYFSDKYEIADELRDRMAAEFETVFVTSLLKAAQLDPEAAFRMTFGDMTAAITQRRGLLRALVAETPMSDSLVVGLERRLLLLGQATLPHYVGQRSASEISAMAFVLGGVGVSTCLRLGLTPPEGIDPDEVLDQTARMLARWLSHD